MTQKLKQINEAQHTNSVNLSTTFVHSFKIKESSVKFLYHLSATQATSLVNV